LHFALGAIPFQVTFVCEQKGKWVHSLTLCSGSVVILLGGPQGMVLRIIDNDVAILLSCQPEWCISFATSICLPDDV
jgi:hypothetical protein